MRIRPRPERTEGSGTIHLQAPPDQLSPREELPDPKGSGTAGCWYRLSAGRPGTRLVPGPGAFSVPQAWRSLGAGALALSSGRGDRARTGLFL